MYVHNMCAYKCVQIDARTVQKADIICKHFTRLAARVQWRTSLSWMLADAHVK